MAGRLAGLGKAVAQIAPKGLQLASQITAAAGAPPAVSQGLAMGAQAATSFGGLSAQA